MTKKLLYIVLTAFMACGLPKKESTAIFFAGEIVNPTNDYVVLYKGDIVLDSTKLDNNNRFSFELDNIDEGLHTFYHKPEIQYVHLEKGDSLLARLNTIAFDESLVFSGRGGEINNFLMEMYLAYDEEEKLRIYDYYLLEPKSFSRKIDSLRAEKTEVLEAILEDQDIWFSEKSIKMAKACIDYNYYIYMEKYPFEHKKRRRDTILRKLPEDFYAYRKTINLNNKDLTSYRPYYSFMTSHLGNLSYIGCSEGCSNWQVKTKNRLHFNKHVLGLIDSLVKEGNLRDNLYRNVAMDYLLMAHDTDENNTAFINAFHKVSNNNRHMDGIDLLYKRIKDLQPNHTVPSLYVHDVEGKTFSMEEISKDKNVVFYFWSATDLKHYNRIQKRVAQLSVQKPEYSFIGINLRTDEKRWKSILSKDDMDENEQYRTANFDELTDILVITRENINKGIIVHDGKIVNGFADLYASF